MGALFGGRPSAPPPPPRPPPAAAPPMLASTVASPGNAVDQAALSGAGFGGTITNQGGAAGLGKSDDSTRKSLLG